MLWFTSDTHFGHQNIIKHCPNSRSRFKSVEEMNETIVQNFHEVMAPNDLLVHLGDISLGNREKSLQYLGRLPGQKIVVPGNHDAIFAGESKSRRERFYPLYAEQVDLIVQDGITFYTNAGSMVVKTSHFPYDGDSHDGDRFTAYRELDDGKVPLVHGHTHSTEKVTRSNKGTLQIHVGVDAWEMYPVPETEVERLIRENI